MKVLDIDGIRQLGGINPNLLNTWADACCVLLEFREHKAPVHFDISGDIAEKVQITWKKIDNDNGYEDLENTAEFAGYGISLLIVNKLKGLKPLGRRAKGTGVDIYCSKEIEDPDNFLNTTSEDYNIEAKGSRNKSGVKPHLKAGINQSAKQSGKVYVISTEFESPSALTHLKG